MTKPHILVSGASVAGPALAYWLVRAGCQVTIVERAPSLRTSGQGIDIRDSARDVIKRMGIFERIKDRSSHEEGIMVVDTNDRSFARFPVDNSGKGDSFTSDLEVLRGELAMVLYDVTKDDVSYIFGETVDSLEETDDEVHVRFSNGHPTTTYNLVVAADGLGSKIRGMVFGDASRVRSLNSYVSYFSIPPDKTDSMWARAYNAVGGRSLVIRPDNVGGTRAILSLTAYDGSDKRLPRLAKASSEGVSAQKALIQELFEDAGWEVERILKGMHESDDYYMQHVAQVQLNQWSKGRVTAVGDACYAPSPFTGMGTSLAFIGAYVLAGEISRQPDNIPAALQAYERVLHPYVDSIQTLPPGIPWAVNPQSQVGLTIQRTLLWAIAKVSTTGVFGIFSTIAKYIPTGKKPFELPAYEAFEKA